MRHPTMGGGYTDSNRTAFDLQPDALPLITP